jgi:phage-related baseplate assembly protein
VSIDLSLLPPPSVVEPLDFETILATIKADALAFAPELSDVLSLESEPATKLCEVFAYRELLLRARINNAAKSTMLAHATDTDLDNLAALFDVQRLPDEKDDRLRRRAQLSLESLSTAGPTKSYLYHALSASNDVLDAYVDSPEPGVVRIAVLADPSDANPDGVPSQALLDTVYAAVSAEDVRPLTDRPVVVGAEVIRYSIAAVLACFPGIGQAAVIQAATDAVAAYVAEQFRLGYDITVSGLKRALRQPGVSRVSLMSPGLPNPAADDDQDVLISVTGLQAALCMSITLSPGGTSA